MPYEDRCNILNWPLLSTRRTYFSLVECYKIVFGLSHLDFQEFFEFAKVHSTRANHSYKLFLKSSKINCFKHSFFIRVVSDWNSLSKDIVEAGTLELFKSRLKSFLKNINIRKIFFFFIYLIKNFFLYIILHILLFTVFFSFHGSCNIGLTSKLPFSIIHTYIYIYIYTPLINLCFDFP